MDTWISLVMLAIALIGVVAGTLTFAFKVGSNNSDMKNAVEHLTGRMAEHEKTDAAAHAVIHGRLDEHRRIMDDHTTQIIETKTNVASLMNKGCAGT
jgi:hypothetical protein